MMFMGKSITLQHVHMQQQAGSYDCGLFALATATAISNGLESGRLEFRQRMMRVHLKNALLTKLLLPFPAKEVPTRVPQLVWIDRVRIYCVCRQPENWQRKMVECSLCKDWFHNDCVKVPEEVMVLPIVSELTRFLYFHNVMFHT